MVMMGRKILFVFCCVLLTWNGTFACFSVSTNKTVFVKTGADYYTECECNTPGYDIKNLLWLNISDLPIGPERPGTGQKVFTVVNESCCVNLHIPFMTKAISGAYKCVTNFEGKVYEQLHYLVAYDPITINPPEKQHIILGNKSLIRCEVHSEPHAYPIVTWYKEDVGNLIKINPSEKYIYAPEGLYINGVTMEDKGKYSCTALDITSSDGVDKDIDVEIVISPVITAVNVFPGETIRTGDHLRIECLADGVPYPEYIFTKTDGEPVNTSRWDQRFNTLVIEKVMPEDQGTYECQAQSMAGVVSKNVSIHVQVSPNITSFSNMTAQEDQTVLLVCNATGRPEPSVSIIFIGNGSNMEEVDENNIIPSLTFIKVNRRNMGIYICNASNEADFTVKSMFLNVEYSPRFDTIAEVVWGWEGRLVNLSCPHDSNPPANLTWRYQGGNEIPPVDQIQINKDLLTPLNENKDTYVTVNVSSDPFPYGVYECKAVNPLGEDTKVITFKEGFVPPPIFKANLLSVEHSTVTFDIIGPDAIEGPEIQGYTSEYDKAENYNVTHIHINRTWSVDRPYVIDSLEPNTTYYIRFAAINQVGNGPWSDILEFQTMEPFAPNVPEWDTDSDLVAVTDMDQEVRWFPSEGNGADVHYYTVKYCLENEELCNEVKVAVNEDFKLDTRMMEFNTTYFINLTAHNDVGDSMAANLTVLMLAEQLPPPALLSAGALIGISVVVVFICLLLLDLLLLMWRRQGIIASCCVRKKKNKGDGSMHTRDKKGLLKDNRDPEETSKADNRHKEFEYNKTTGIITGRHSAV